MCLYLCYFKYVYSCLFFILYLCFIGFKYCAGNPLSGRKCEDAVNFIILASQGLEYPFMSGDEGEPFNRDTYDGDFEKLLQKKRIPQGDAVPQWGMIVHSI